MELQTLQLLTEVVRRGSFAAVARDRNIAPSSVSRAIAGLEDELGARLLSRSTRRLELTEAGARYIERLGPLLDELDQANLMVRDAAERPAGLLRISAPVTFGQLVLVDLLPALAERHPDLDFELRLESALVDLVGERIDVAVRLGRMAESSLVARRLCAMRYAVCASPAYLERAGTPRAPADLAAHQCLRFPVPGQPARWRFRDRNDGAIAEVAVSGRVIATNGIALRALAAAGMGVVMLPRWNVAGELRSGRLVELLGGFEGTTSEFDLAAWAVYPSRAYLPLKVRAFVDHLSMSLSENA